MTWSVSLGWLASSARALGEWWFTSTPSQSAVHGSATRDPLRAGVLARRLRFFRVTGWVTDIGGCIAGRAHPSEKNAAHIRNATIHRLCSAEVWIRWRSNRIIVAEWLARSKEFTSVSCHRFSRWFPKNGHSAYARRYPGRYTATG
jgi:hypothetical protein